MWKPYPDLVRDLYGDVSDEFISEILINCTSFPHGNQEHIKWQLQEVYDATNGSKDLGVAIEWSTAELDRTWREYRKNHPTDE